jgi:hypothetical protein
MAARSRKSLAAIGSDSGFADAMSIIQNWLLALETAGDHGFGSVLGGALGGEVAGYGVAEPDQGDAVDSAVVGTVAAAVTSVAAGVAAGAAAIPQEGRPYTVR